MSRYRGSERRSPSSRVGPLVVTHVSGGPRSATVRGPVASALSARAELLLWSVGSAGDASVTLRTSLICQFHISVIFVVLRFALCNGIQCCAKYNRHELIVCVSIGMVIDHTKEQKSKMYQR